MLVYNPLWHQIPSNAYTSNAVKLLSPWSLLSSRMFSTPFRKTCWPIPPALFTYFYLQTFRQDTFSNQNALLLPLHETLSNFCSKFTSMTSFLMTSTHFQLFQRRILVNQATWRGQCQRRRKLGHKWRHLHWVRELRNEHPKVLRLPNAASSFSRRSAHKTQLGHPHSSSSLTSLSKIINPNLKIPIFPENQSYHLPLSLSQVAQK